MNLNAKDRAILNKLQDGFPLSERPYKEAAESLGLDEDELISRLGKLLEDGVLSRFGPMYHAERLGGELTLAALKVPQERFDEVTELVNAHVEVAHNYERSHALNMWFVIATESVGRQAEVIAEIEAETGLEVRNMPKTEEFFVGLRFRV